MWVQWGDIPSGKLMAKRQKTVKSIVPAAREERKLPPLFSTPLVIFFLKSEHSCWALFNWCLSLSTSSLNSLFWDLTSVSSLSKLVTYSFFFFLERLADSLFLIILSCRFCNLACCSSDTEGLEDMLPKIVWLFPPVLARWVLPVLARWVLPVLARWVLTGEVLSTLWAPTVPFEIEKVPFGTMLKMPSAGTLLRVTLGCIFLVLVMPLLGARERTSFLAPLVQTDTTL